MKPNVTNPAKEKHHPHQAKNLAEALREMNEIEMALENRMLNELEKIVALDPKMRDCADIQEGLKQIRAGQANRSGGVESVCKHLERMKEITPHLRDLLGRFYNLEQKEAKKQALEEFAALKPHHSHDEQKVKEYDQENETDLDSILIRKTTH